MSFISRQEITYEFPDATVELSGSWPKTIVILGATGSIGTAALAVIRSYARYFKVVGLAAGNNSDALLKLIDEFNPTYACLSDLQANRCLADNNSSSCQIIDNEERLETLVTAANSDIVLVALPGISGLKVTLTALALGKTVALASKEVLCMAGGLVQETAAANGATIIPVDSEHSALQQAMLAGKYEEIRRWYLTASGGPFRDYTRNQLHTVKAEHALSHPTWEMGRKITIDSATLANKAFEVMEAHWLFNADYENISVLIHRESIVHGLVEFCDSSLIAQLAVPDMKGPIQSALFWPHRLPGLSAALNLLAIGKLSFEEPDQERFPLLSIGLTAAKQGGFSPAAFSVANELAVNAFLSGKIGFFDMAELAVQTINATQTTAEFTQTALFDFINYAQEKAESFLPKLSRNARQWNFTVKNNENSA